MKQRKRLGLYCAALALLCAAPIGRAADLGATGVTNPPPDTGNLPIGATNVTVVETTPHSKTYFVPDGRTNALGVPQGRTIQAVGTGMNYWSGSNYVPSQAVFETDPQGTAFI